MRRDRGDRARVGGSLYDAPLRRGGKRDEDRSCESPAGRVANASTTAVKTAPLVGANIWHIQTVDTDNTGEDTSLALTSTNWPAISYWDILNADLKYAYKNAAGWHNETVDSAGEVGSYSSLRLTSAGWPAISYYDATNSDLKYAYKSAI